MAARATAGAGSEPGRVMVARISAKGGSCMEPMAVTGTQTPAHAGRISAGRLYGSAAPRAAAAWH